MDLRSLLLARLAARAAPLNVVHVGIENWIVFYRDSFERWDPEDDPYAPSQMFLIEITTGRYVHRAQGHKVDCGTSQDLDLLQAKLTEAFQEARACQGWPPALTAGPQAGPPRLKAVDYPYPRRVSLQCQFLGSQDQGVKCESEAALDHGRGHGPGPRFMCHPCREAGPAGPLREADPANAHNLEALMHVKAEIHPPEEEEKDLDESQLFPSDLAHVSFDELDCDASDLGFDYDSHENEDENEDDDEDEEADEEEKEARGPKKKRLKKAKREREDDDLGQYLPNGRRRVYDCNHCSKTFTSSPGYHKHMKLKRGMNCRECKKRVITFNDLIKHVSDKHPSQFEEYLKYGQFDEDETRMHVPRKCILCDMMFNGNVLLYRHKQLYHEMGDYNCSDCGHPCLTYYDLAIHYYQEHAKALEYRKPHSYGLDIVAHKDDKIEKKRVKFVCEHCQASYNTDPGWTLHLRTHHSWGLFECKPCDEICHYAHEISAHQINFHKDKPEVTCPSCSKVVDLRDDRDAFNQHYKSCPHVANKAIQKNNGEKKSMTFQCHYCGKNYSSKTSFDSHIKQHQGIERFKCSQCDYGTNTKNVLLDHEKMHLREKGLTNADTNLVLFHQCDQCGKQYSNIQGLRGHVKRVHLGIKPSYPCADCDLVVSSKSMLYRHKREMHGFVNNVKKKGRRNIAGFEIK
ncbi:hypothetical protein TCAL_06269 [Tigriopus californicus]|uniref:C2H2-type domain-containing protein n=1 Tax=Tigriopus californicus TaxID=6832 RepID=A0A553NEH4_TIGCA|nr:zinc finger protein 62 homolog [Tigriopus californicus]TRY63847.1 hypothetical protein TCAL_06269 [Tigriopus californicus]|eukprot:TCALIF_06269-PA protein Name:"Similar to ZFP62 Zinc finger protein 62 homolog (Homo sapiens)" AED:0.20 eAED:0.20 QI:0/-1/0/1/-1/1/1/0/685